MEYVFFFVFDKEDEEEEDDEDAIFGGDSGTTGLDGKLEPAAAFLCASDDGLDDGLYPTTGGCLYIILGETDADSTSLPCDSSSSVF